MDTNSFIVPALTLLALLAFYRKVFPRGHKSTNNLPSPPSFPVIGHLHLLTSMPHHVFTNLYLRFGPLLGLRLGQVRTVIVSSAAVAKQVLKTHDHVFCDRPQLLSAQYLSFGCSDVTFSSYGPYWRQARKICVSELLSTRRVHSFELIRKEEVGLLIEKVMNHAGKEIDLSRLFFQLANDVVCRVAFGKRFEQEEGEKNSLVDVLKETQELFAGFCLGDFFPSWEWVNWVTGYRKRLVNTTRRLSAVCDEIITNHEAKKKMESTEEDEDFVDVLIGIQKRKDLEVPITGDNLKALVLDMFVAGTDTTSATLEWTMTELARHPEVMKRVQEEVRNVGAGKRTLQESDLHSLQFMRAAIKESMRLHPAVPLLVPRQSMEKCVLEGYAIPKGSRIVINWYAIGRDPRSWKDPLVYNPDRFMEEEVDFKDQDFRFLPFGGGRRGCPGYSFGLATIEIALARLLYHFDWALPEGADANRLNLEEDFGLATRKRCPLVLVPSPPHGFGSF